jgi:hypothetical protein
MHSLRLTPVALALCLSVAGAQNLDDYKISLCIDGTPVTQSGHSTRQAACPEADT